MNPLQQWLTENNGDLVRLTSELGIAVTRHPTLPLVAFKYDQLDSPKTNDVVRYSRGTVLEDKTWNLVAMPFVRFFNYGENVEEGKRFNWNKVIATTKEDGSLMICYWYAGEWHINTSGSFGFGKVRYSNKTWREYFWEAFNLQHGKIDALQKNRTYIFEFCSLDNQVVRLYPEPRVYLLSVTQDGIELGHEEVNIISKEISITRPMDYNFKSIDEVLEFLSKKEEEDKTFEGVVIRDDANIRAKVKSKTYLALAHLADGGNIANPKHLVNFALAGEGDELVATFPYLKDRFNEIKNKLDKFFNDLLDLWSNSKGIDSQKDFALKIKSNPFSSILFQLRKSKGINLGEVKDLKAIWRESSELAVKRLEETPKRSE